MGDLRRQAGFAVMALIVVISIIAFTLLSIYSGHAAQSAKNRLVAEQAAYLADARERVEAWYARNLGEVDRPGGGVPPDLLARAGVTERWSVRWLAQPMPPVPGPQGSKVHWTQIALWLPVEGDSSGMGPQGFQPTPGVLYQTVDGLPLQRRAVADTLARLNSVALKFQGRFAAKLEHDPSHDIINNWFTPPSGECGAVRPDDIPCVTDYAPLERYLAASDGTLGLAATVGLTDALVRDAWGGQLEFTNLGDGARFREPGRSNTPYSLALRARTPWEDMLRVYAVQPL